MWCPSQFYWLCWFCLLYTSTLFFYVIFSRFCCHGLMGQSQCFSGGVIASVFFECLSYDLTDVYKRQAAAFFCTCTCTFMYKDCSCNTSSSGCPCTVLYSNVIIYNNFFYVFLRMRERTTFTLFRLIPMIRAISSVLWFMQMSMASNSSLRVSWG